MRVREVRRLVTVLMQEPVQYSATVAQNIALGDLESSPGRAAIEKAIGEAGADEIVTRLPEGHETLLGKWFAGGADLSVGEWQRIALARAFQRRAPVIILDEPTSAMDPWAEADWLERFRALAQGRTALIITHRFTTAMYADRIHVMDEGRVIESGGHEELLAKGGAYARAWQRQMRAGAIAPR
jgi:ATP-binding cassette subfamily B protein